MRPPKAVFALALLAPIGASIYPIVHTYWINIDQVAGSMIGIPFVVSALVGLGLMGLFSLFFRHPYKGSLMAVALITASTLIDHVGFLAHKGDLNLWLAAFLECGIAIFILGSAFFACSRVRSPDSWRKITEVSALFVAILVLPASAQILWHRYRPLQIPAEQGAAGGTMGRTGPSVRPDIYYIILDGYGRQDTLQSLLGIDSSAFVAFLKQKGFYVAPKSRSNYNYTRLSLASSLNMDYLGVLHHDLRQEIPMTNSMIAHNLVSKILKQQGYTIVHIFSGWSFGTTKRDVDITINPQTFDEFDRLVINASLSRFFIRHWMVTDERRAILHNLDKLGEMPRLPGPKFVYAHIDVPHPPYLFQKDGRYNENGVKLYDPTKSWLPASGYAGQVAYISGRMEKILSDILRQSPAPPIIIVQGDHGPATIPEDTPDQGAMIREQTSILNAYYGPPAFTSRLYPTITPVNTFRLLFSSLFGLPIKPLPDKIYRRHFTKPIMDDVS